MEDQDCNIEEDDDVAELSSQLKNVRHQYTINNGKPDMTTYRSNIKFNDVNLTKITEENLDTH